MRLIVINIRLLQIDHFWFLINYYRIRQKRYALGLNYIWEHNLRY